MSICMLPELLRTPQNAFLAMDPEFFGPSWKTNAFTVTFRTGMDRSAPLVWSNSFGGVTGCRMHVPTEGS